MTIYTGQGDRGQTSLADGSRIPKDDPRVEAYGTVDEVNSLVGFARSATDDPYLLEVLDFLQQRLLNCSGSLAMPIENVSSQTPHISPADVQALEHAIDRLIAAAGEIDHFVVPAGGELSSRLHVARTVMRRAERRAVTLSDDEAVEAEVLRFLNRSSDLLYAAARYAAAREGAGDEFWDPSEPTAAI